MMYNKYMLSKNVESFIWTKWDILGNKWVMGYKKLQPSEIIVLFQ